MLRRLFNSKTWQLVNKKFGLNSERTRKRQYLPVFMLLDQLEY